MYLAANDLLDLWNMISYCDCVPWESRRGHPTANGNTAHVGDQIVSNNGAFACLCDIMWCCNSYMYCVTHSPNHP